MDYLKQVQYGMLQQFWRQVNEQGENRMSISKATSMEDVIARLEYISKRLEEFESPEDFALSMSIDECIDYLRKNTKSSWHTGTPTEEGWYIVHVKSDLIDKPFDVIKFKEGKWWDYLEDVLEVVSNDYIIAWRRIEPYEE